jgi:signal transduction histidine kinase/HAMP domain-containing protein/putative methionine-R-sulfoxide reductase with GAF domain
VKSLLSNIAQSSAFEFFREGARSPLFRKYVALFLAVVTTALLINGLFSVWFAYQENRASLIRLQKEQADSAAAKIGQFVREIENQLGWTTQLPWSTAAIEQRRFDGLRLLRQVPAITELVQLDGKGLEQLRVSRLSMDAVGSLSDNSKDEKFAAALANKIYYGPVYFRRESEPYMTVAMAGTRREAGVSVAEVNLKFIWDVVSQIRVGQTGQAFVVDAEGRLLAHPDISLVLRKTDVSKFEQVLAARNPSASDDKGRIHVATDVRGQRVLTAHAVIAPLGWLVFVELPEHEANAPLRSALKRSAVLLLGGLSLALMAGLFLARRMLVPIEAIRAGAMLIGSGDLEHRISIKTGDELEQLANSFNDMAGRLDDSYTDLEGKIETRTRELARSIADLKALGEVSQSVNSTLDMKAVLATVVAKAVQLSRSEAGAIYVLEQPGDAFEMRATYQMSDALIAEVNRQQGNMGLTLVGRAVQSRAVVQVPDLHTETENPVQKLLLAAGFRSVLAVPLVGVDKVVGCLIVRRKQIGEFEPQVVDLMQTFAAQSVLALQNARLFDEVQARTAELTDTLQYQTATSEVLSVISKSPNALQPVLESIVETARRLCKAERASILRRNGNSFALAAFFGNAMAPERMQRFNAENAPLDRTSLTGRVALERRTIHLVDKRADPDLRYLTDAAADDRRTMLGVPLLRDGIVEGVIILVRTQVLPFTDKQIALVTTFADQAVIAINNVGQFTEIQDKSRQLEIASQHKSQFLANMSHELRTPLNAILGYTELIIDGVYGAVPEKSRQVLDRVQVNGKHLLSLINDVLDLSKIEAGQLSLTLADYKVTSLIDGVVSATGSLAQAKGLDLRTKIAPGLPIAYGDERRLKQVMLNLVGNAIKFTDKGYVEVAASRSGNDLVLSVRDTGPGIAAADQSKVFEEFQQVDTSSTKEKGGSGLGLAITKRIVEMHGGTIQLVSDVGAGSTFTVILPVRVSAAEKKLESAQ